MSEQETHSAEYLASHRPPEPVRPLYLRPRANLGGLLVVGLFMFIWGAALASIFWAVV